MNTVRPFRAITLLAVLPIAASLTAQTSSIVNSVHNLSVSGPGAYHAQAEGEVCIFCHAPHNASLQAPLWNRDDSRASYLTYQSTTFQGAIAQPNGSTKLCLSCHDGTIALGKVVSLGQTEIAMQAGRRFLDQGEAFLGTNLRDDHPVSFAYDGSRGGSSSEFVPARSIPHPVQLDGKGQVQCTSCHDAHDDSFGNFLRTTDRQGALCLACHQPAGWTASAHRSSSAQWNGAGADPWPRSDYTTVADNACANCHVPHGAGQPARLLQPAVEDDTCLRCHGGNVAQRDIRSQIARPSGHNALATTGVHDAAEDPLVMARHAECQDCHNPHAARAGRVPAPGVPGPIQQVSGIDSSGTPVAHIGAGYELCYKCHADNNGGTAHIPRAIQQTNVRLEFRPGNPSFHPIETTGVNPNVPSLLPPWTISSRLACTDCHQGNDSPDFGGNGPSGPHGSVFAPLLGANYSTIDNQSESPTAYALCYKCHSRTSILANQSFREHRKHIVEERAPCSICHDAHGISASQGTGSNNTHLINFDTRSVQANNGVRQFQDNGLFRGQCTLLCHGEGHNNKNY